MNIIIKGKKEIKKKLNKLEGALIRGTVRAINKTAAKVKTQASKEIRQEISLPAAYVKGKLKLEKATRFKPYAVVAANRRGLLLSRFSPKQLTRNAKKGGKKNAGISIKVGTKERRKKMRGAFFIKLKDSKAIGIAIRDSSAKLGYTVLHGPSVSQVYDTIKDGMVKDIGAWYYDNATHEIGREIKKIGFN